MPPKAMFVRWMRGGLLTTESAWLNASRWRQNMSVQCASSLRCQRPCVVGVVAGLGEQRRAVVELGAEPVHRGLEEVRRGHDLVVVDEDDRVVAEHRGGHEADVAHRAVALERDAVDHVGELELLEAAVQAAQLGGAEDERVDVGEVVDDLAHLVLGAVLDRLVGCGDDDDDAAEALDLLQRAQAVRQRAVGVDRCRVVVDAREVVDRDGRAAALGLRLVQKVGNDDDWVPRVQTLPCRGQFAGPSSGPGT